MPELLRTQLMVILPETLLALFAMGILLLDLVVKRKGFLALLTLVAAVCGFFALSGGGTDAWNGMFIADGYSMFFKVIFLVSLVLSVLVSFKYVRIERINHGEYYALMLFATIGMMVMASAGDLITLYLGLELMSLCLYVLSGFMRDSVRSN